MKRLSFNDEMMKAWLGGRKTVTRRLMKPQPKDHHWDILPGYKFGHKIMDCIDGLYCKFWHYIPGRDIDGEQWIRSPYSPGETVLIGKSKAIIKSIRPERVREITAPDIRNEGTPDTPHDSNCLIAERQSFIDLWDSLYPGSWERNDWVWRYGLERVG